MAYVGHSPFRDFHDLRGALPYWGSFSLVVRSALVALAVGAAIVALCGSETSTQAAPDGVALMKADRLAPPRPAANVGTAGYVVDAANRTTTVERGAATPLSPESPLGARGL